MTQPNSKYVRSAPHKALAGGITSRVVVGIALIVISVVSASAVLKANHGSVEVLVFLREIDAGAVLSESDVAEAGVAAPSKTLEQLVPVAERQSIVGMRLTRQVRAGEPVVRSSLSSRAPEGRVVSIPVSRAGSTPNLAPGESVDVVASFAPQSEEARTVVVASSLQLISLSDAPVTEAEVPTADPMASQSSPERILASVAASGPEVVKLVFASQNGSISLVRSVPGENLSGYETSAFAPSLAEIPEE